MELEFRKKSILKGVEAGYYLNNKFLGRYKSKVITLLREAITKAGQGDFQKGKELMPVEWEVIHNEYLKGEEKNKKTHEKKKVYYDEFHINSLKNRVFALQNKIEIIVRRKQEVERMIAEKINLIRAEQEKIKEIISKSEGEIK